MSTASPGALIASGKRPALFTLPHVEYYENLATVSIRRLWWIRSRDGARDALRGWIGTLRDAKRVRNYRGWNA